MSSREVSVVLPIYNAPDETAECIAALERTLGRETRVILINDGSSDGQISTLLADTLRRRPEWTVIDRRENRGFVRTVNEALRLVARGHVVILNSDTRVTPGWLEGMVRAAESDALVASVTPWSNAATICSLFEYCVERPMPANISEDDVADLLARCSPTLYPKLPTGVGFCMLMTDRAIAELGYFDELSFPRGYGEENEWCERAKWHGFHHRLADATFVYHKGSASFGAHQQIHRNHGRKVLEQRWPEYFVDVATFVQSNALRPYVDVMRNELAKYVRRRARGQLRDRPRVLHVVHCDPRGDRVAGVEVHIQQLLELPELNEEFHNLVLWPTEFGFAATTEALEDSDDVVTWSGSEASEFAGRIGKHPLWNQVLDELRPDVVHVHHLLRFGPSFVHAAAARCPVVVTAHDHLLICPRYNLLRPDLNAFCGIPVDLAICHRCLGMSDLKRLTSISAWRDAMKRALSSVRAIIAPSNWISQALTTVYPELAPKIQVLGHPTPMPIRALHGTVPSNGEPLRVLVLGYRANEKGTDVLDIVAQATPGVRYLLLGQVEPGGGSRLANVEFLGEYRRAEVYKRIAGAACHVALFLSRTPESFSFTLSEVLLSGLTAIVPDQGALGERVRASASGWTYRPEDGATEVAKLLDRLAREPTLLTAKAVAAEPERTLCLSEDYSGALTQLYRLTLANARPHRSTPPIPAPVAVDRSGLS